MPEMKEWIETHCRDLGHYPLVFDKNFGVDIKVPNHPEYFIKILDKPVVRIEITSWRGISVGAVHWYANIYAEAPRICSKDKDGGVSVHVGYICKEWKQMPKEITDMIGCYYRIEARRPVTMAEIEKNPNRWEGYKIGDTTPAFNSKEEALAVAVKIARYRLPFWKVEVKYLI